MNGEKSFRMNQVGSTFFILEWIDNSVILIKELSITIILISIIKNAKCGIFRKSYSYIKNGIHCNLFA